MCKINFSTIEHFLFHVHNIRMSLLYAVIFFGFRDFNIMDTMITMMEKYTDHLEEIVAERTSELAAEKAKTDELLYRMLPRYQGYIVPRSVKGLRN